MITRATCALPLVLAACATGVYRPPPLPAGDLPAPEPDWPAVTAPGPLFAAPLNADDEPDRSAAVRQDQAADDPVAQWGTDGGVGERLPSSAIDAARAALASGVRLQLSQPVLGPGFTFEAFVRGPSGRIVTASAGDRVVFELAARRDLRIVIGAVTILVENALDDRWHHLGVLVDGAERRVLVTRNHQVIAWRELKEAPQLPETATWVLGGDPAAEVDEAAVYDRALVFADLRARSLVAEGYRRPRSKRGELPMELVLQRGHSGGIFAVDLSAAGRYGATAGADGGAILWDVATGQQLRTFKGPYPGVIMSVEIGPAERVIALSGGYTTLFDLETGELLRAFRGGSTRVALSRDGRWLAAQQGTLDEVVIWRIDDGRELARLRPGAPVTALASSANGLQLLLGTMGGTLHRYNIIDDVMSDRETGLGIIESIAASSNGKYIAVAGAGSVRVYTSWLAPLEELDTLGLTADSVAFPSDDRLLLARTAMPAVEISMPDGKKLRETAATLGPQLIDAHYDKVLAATFADDGLWSATTGSLVHPLSRGDSAVTQVVFAGEGATLGLTLPGQGAALFDLRTARRRDRILGPVLALDATATRVLGNLPGAAGYLLATVAEKRQQLISGPGAPALDSATPLAALPDGAFLAVTGDGERLTVQRLDASGARTILETRVTSTGSSFSVSRSGRRAMLGEEVFDTASGRVIARFEKSGYGAFSPDDRTVFLNWRVGLEPILADVASGRTIWSLPDQASGGKAVFSPDGRRIAHLVDFTGKLRILSADSGRAEREIAVETQRPHMIDFSPDGRWIAIAATDGFAELIHTSGEPRLRLVNRGEQWVIMDGAQRFAGSRDAHELVSAVQGLRVFAVDQVALERNRPDEILAGLGGADSGALQYYRARVRRRHEQHGMTGSLTGGTVPRARIRSAKVTGDHAAVSAALSDDEGLSSYTFWVNGNPVETRRVEGRHADVQTSIPLLPGANRIELSATDTGGLEAIRALRIVEGPAADKPGTLYYVGLGVSAYERPELALRYAHKDARDLGEALAKLDTFAKVEVAVRTDAEVVPGVVGELARIVAGAKPEDTVVVFAAGHGLHDRDEAATYYFLGHRSDPARLAETAIPFDRFEALLAGSKARRKLLLIDTCESGELDLPTGALEGALAPGTISRAARGLQVQATRAAPRPYAIDRERFFYRDLARRSGAIVFASSRGDQASYESTELENGYFTEEILDAITGAADEDGDGAVGMEELRAHVTRGVVRRSAERQHPVVDRENIHQGFVLPVKRNDDVPIQSPRETMAGYWALDDKETRLRNQAAGVSGSPLDRYITERAAYGMFIIARDRFLTHYPGFFHVAREVGRAITLKVMVERMTYSLELTFGGPDRMCVAVEGDLGKVTCYRRDIGLAVHLAPGGASGGMRVLAMLDSSLPDVRIGDELVRVDGRTVRSLEDIGLALATKKPGEAVRFELMRGGTPVETVVRLDPPRMPQPESRQARIARVPRIQTDADELVATITGAVQARWRRAWGGDFPGHAEYSTEVEIDHGKCVLRLERASKTETGSYRKEKVHRAEVDLAQLDPTTVAIAAMPKTEEARDEPPVRALFADSYPGDWAQRFTDDTESGDGPLIHIELAPDRAQPDVAAAFRELVARCGSLRR